MLFDICGLHTMPAPKAPRASELDLPRENSNPASPSCEVNEGDMFVPVTSNLATVLAKCRLTRKGIDEFHNHAHGDAAAGGHKHHAQHFMSQPKVIKAFLQSLSSQLAGVEELVFQLQKDYLNARHVENNKTLKDAERIEFLEQTVQKLTSVADVGTRSEWRTIVNDLAARETQLQARVSLLEEQNARLTKDVDKELRPPENTSIEIKQTSHKWAACNFEDAHELTDLLHEAEAGDWGRYAHQTHYVEYIFFFVWLAALMCCYCFQRLLCGFGLPNDCKEKDNADLLFRDFWDITVFGILLAVLVGVNEKDKFLYVFNFLERGKYHKHEMIPNGYIFLLLLFGICPLWSLLDEVPFLRDFSLQSGGFLDAGHLVLAILIIFLVFVLLIAHIIIGMRYNEGCGFVAYVLSKAFLLSLIIGYFTSLAVAAEGYDCKLHLHHYAIGWICATFAEFSHPLSLALLAIGTGVYVQGIAAYGPDGFLDPILSKVKFERLDGTVYESPWLKTDAVDFFEQHCL